MFDNKNILVTGGTGSFGQRLIRNLLDRYSPRRIVVFSRDELKQFEMQQKFQEKCMRFFLGDVRDLGRLEKAMQDVDYVIHAAALKQVPAAEYNPMEFIKTNVLGGQNVIDAAITNKVKKVIALSTDKAANPINLYGATKLCSDKLFVAANNISGAAGTRFAVVRYGNVLGSRGSVVPLYQKLMQDQPKQLLPVTHPEMTRFWITLQQGVDLVIDSFARMLGGEVFVPKIPSVRILDLVEALTGSREYTDIGVRPGEKLHEVMCPEEVSLNTWDFGDYYSIEPTINLFDENVEYDTNALGVKGKKVAPKFEYSSGVNDDFLSVKQIQKSIQESEF